MCVRLGVHVQYGGIVTIEREGERERSKMKESGRDREEGERKGHSEGVILNY